MWPKYALHRLLTCKHRKKRKEEKETEGRALKAVEDMVKYSDINTRPCTPSKPRSFVIFLPISTYTFPYLTPDPVQLTLFHTFKNIMSDTIHGSAAGPAKPLIFVLTLGDDQAQNAFQTSHARLLNELFERATVCHAKTAEKAFSLFTKCGEPHAVFVTDGGIARPRCEVISQRLVQYAASGGIVVFGGSFAASSQEELEKILKYTWDLPWEFGSYHRTTLSLNSQAVSSTLKGILPASYSQKALYIYGMQQCEAWYLPTKDSVVEECVPIPRPIADFNESPVVFARCGNGHVGFIGDVQPEEGTILAMLAMMGLLI
ncbi:hypothetical protein V8C37DRAFT_389147 [Trichoderma ceciliae]